MHKLYCDKSELDYTLSLLGKAQSMNFLTAKLNDQFCFKTNESLKAIRFVGSFKVDL